jgi:hypothetical protein
MKMFVWKYLSEDVTSSYHSGGGLAVVAASLPRARALLIETRNGGSLDDPLDDPATCGAQTKDPDFVYDLSDDLLPIVHVFADSGCC